MCKIESSSHLYQSPQYVSDNKIYDNFEEALVAAPKDLTIDHAAISSFLSFGYVTGDRTIFNQIKRLPWLSKGKNDKIEIMPVPNHELYSSDYKTLAIKFYDLILEEVRIAIKGFDNVYVLLSGGLDSRIVAGIVCNLYKEGIIKYKPIGVTWGLDNSRDVVYGKKMAEMLDFEWQYIPITPDNVLENISIAGKDLGLIHSPELLHNMNWLNANTKKNSIVLAGSYGDSIGRGEFSGVHLLDLKKPKPKDNFNLLVDEIKKVSFPIVEEDINNLFQRSKSKNDYAFYECFQQGYRMRNGLSHALSIVNKKSRIYQVFTCPNVYGFIWSIHPSYRGDEIYENLLEIYFPQLARVPWARTNKALAGKTIGKRKDLRKDYHLYTQWSKRELRHRLEKIIDIDWFEKTKIFNKKGLIQLRENVRNSESRVGRTNEFWLWLAGMKSLHDFSISIGKTISYEVSSGSKLKGLEREENKSFNDFILKHVSKSEILTRLGKKIRKLKRDFKLDRTKRRFIKKFPTKHINY